MTNNECRRNTRILKITICNHHKNNLLRQELSTEYKTIGLKFEEGQDIYKVLKYLSTDYLLVIKRKMIKLHSGEAWKTTL